VSRTGGKWCTGERELTEERMAVVDRRNAIVVGGVNGAQAGSKEEGARVTGRSTGEGGRVRVRVDSTGEGM
jgi:hypothetical protein